MAKGSRGGKRGETSESKYIEDIARQMTKYIPPDSDEKPLSNGDMQALVEAYAMTHKGVNEDSMINAIRDRAEEIAIERNIAGVSGYTVKQTDGKTSEWYFAKNGNDTYYKTSLSGQFEPTPNGMTEKEMVSRLKTNSNGVSKLSKSQMVAKEKARIEDRKATDAFLDQAYLRDKTFVKGSRMERKRVAQSRRKR